MEGNGNKNRYVLIIDDDARNIFALSAVLKAKGFTCISATSAEDGFARIEDHKDELGIVLLDMMMPEMDGYETLARFGSGPFAEVPVVAVTAQAMTGDRERCLEAGADDYISKPVNVDKLLLTIRKFIK